MNVERFIHSQAHIRGIGSNDMGALHMFHEHLHIVFLFHLDLSTFFLSFRIICRALDIHIEISVSAPAWNMVFVAFDAFYSIPFEKNKTQQQHNDKRQTKNENQISLFIAITVNDISKNIRLISEMWNVKANWNNNTPNEPTRREKTQQQHKTHLSQTISHYFHLENQDEKMNHTWMCDA